MCESEKIKRMTIIFAFVLIGFVDQTFQSPWTYHDESHWPGMCRAGTKQSPINLVSKEAVTDYRGLLIKGPLVFRGYTTVDVYGENNGHTLKWNAVPGSPAPTLSGGPLRGNYTFMQFHLHWLSEHAIEGVKYPLEIHMVHAKTGLSKAEAVMQQDGLAVVGILAEVKTGERSENALGEIMSSVPELLNFTPGYSSNANIIDLTQMFSTNPQSYYTYYGSLTTPDCDEGVRWIVMDKPISITDEQYKMISGADVGGIANFRSLQPTNRVVYHSRSCASVTFPSSLSILISLFYCTSTSIIKFINNGVCFFYSIKKKILGKAYSIKC